MSVKKAKPLVGNVDMVNITDNQDRHGAHGQLGGPL